MRKKLLFVVLFLSIVLNCFLFYKYFKEDIKKVVYSNKKLENKSTDPPVLFYCLKDTVKSLSINYNTIGTKSYDGSLIVAPGIYNVNGVAVDMSKEGLYRLLFIGEKNYQIISYDKDIVALVSAYAWIVTHGNADNKLSQKQLTQKALGDKLSLTCGYISKYLNKKFGELGIKSRVVSGLTLDSWNSYDNSHVLVEVFHPELEKWVVADVDGNTIFTDTAQTTYYSLMELSQNLKTGNFERVHLATDNYSDISGFSNKGYSYALLSSCKGAESMKDDWYKRVLDVIFIDNYYYDTRDTARVNCYSTIFNYMDSAVFVEKFY